MKIKTLLIGSGVELLLLLVNDPTNVWVVNFGLPFPWLIKWFDHLMSDQWFWEVNVVNLIADIVIWTVIIFVVVKVLSSKLSIR